MGRPQCIKNPERTTAESEGRAVIAFRGQYSSTGAHGAHRKGSRTWWNFHVDRQHRERPPNRCVQSAYKHRDYLEQPSRIPFLKRFPNPRLWRKLRLHCSNKLAVERRRTPLFSLLPTSIREQKLNRRDCLSICM